MEFLEKMNSAIDYLEANLDQHIDYALLAKQAGCSEYHFSRMFAFMTGQSLSLYIRRRRLSKAAMELVEEKTDLLDIAVKYGYSSVDAFSRAFREVHGISPGKIAGAPARVRIFSRITFNVSISGGQEMTYRFVEKDAFRIVGVMKRVPLVFKGPNPEIDAMWRSLDMEKIRQWKTLSDTEPSGIVSASAKFSEDRMTGNGTLDHYIGSATTRPARSGDTVLEVDAALWAVFESIGKFPETLQSIWGRIYSEWFPSVPYELSPGPEILWNESPDTSLPNYRSEIWIPVRKK